MDKRVLMRHIERMTPQQIGSMKKIYKKYVLSIVAVVLIGLIVGLCFFVVFHVKQEEAKDRWDALEAEYDYYDRMGLTGHTLSISGDKLEAIDEYYDMKQTKAISFILTPAIWLIGLLVVYLVFKVKYPYFSEKIYSYLKKTNNPHLR